MQTQNRKNQNCSIKKFQPKQNVKKHVPVSENSTGMEILQAALKGFKLQLFCVLYFSSTFQVFLSIFIFYLCVGEKWQIILCMPGEQSIEKPRLGYGSLQFRGQPLFTNLCQRRLFDMLLHKSIRGEGKGRKAVGKALKDDLESSEHLPQTSASNSVK